MLGIIKNAANGVTKIAGKTGLRIRKVSPEILVGAGVVGVVAATVLACKATHDHVDDILDEAKDQLEELNAETKESLTEKEYKKEVTKVYFHSGTRIVKAYGPAVSLGTLSIFFILYGHNLLRKRTLATAAAYKALEESFNRYKKRVAEELGEDVENRIRKGIRYEKKEVETEDENGKKSKTKEVIETIDPNEISEYAKFFDSSSVNWNKNPEYNLLFLRSQQNYANNLLKARGHVFLNEVYDMLDIPRTSAGAVVGWVLGAGDDFIDFGIYDINSDGRNFVNGNENVILLDFNVDGLIYDKI